MTAWSELDHIIFFCGTDAPEASALLDRGLHEGPRNSHPGQGTANRRFFFRNAYLELLWVENFTEAQSPVPRSLGLADRWQRRDAGVCPIGLVFRSGRRTLARPIDSWTYTPSYFPPGFSIEVAKDIPDNEPLLFYLPFARPTLVEERDAGPALVGDIVDAVLHLPATMQLSPALDALVGAGVLGVEPARQYRIDLRHVGGARDVIDCRPTLPLRFVPFDTQKKRPAA
ncbi:MAG TPA: VOC family protein [Steroidobacteraceae bacterium]|nr:VOC family protein [Steroidobacteraceae bacterium]